MTLSSSPPPEPESISYLMRRLMEKAAHDENVTVGHILDIFGVRGFAFLLLMLAILNVVIFMVPFLSILFGVPMIILSVQMLLGFEVPIFPAFVRQRSIDRQALADGLARAVRWMERVEQYIKPRFLFLSASPLRTVHGLLALMLAIMVALPIPVINVPPSIALVMLAIGILQRDGIFIAAAYTGGFWCFWLFRSLEHFAHVLTH